jgi:hypothetical protein
MFELRSSEFERFSQSSASFLSEAGTVLTFFCFGQDKKMKRNLKHLFLVSRQKNEEA